MISVGGISSGKSITNIFSGALRTARGSLTTSVFGWMRSSRCVVGDVGEVERRVLPHQDDVERRELDALRLAEREVVALLVAHVERLHGREHLVAGKRQPVGRVIGDRVAPRCCASSSSAKVESPRMLIRSIGSMCTAIFRLIRFSRRFPAAMLYAILALLAT